MKRVLIVMALGLVGCGAPGGPVVTHPVSGAVAYDGKPAAGVRVYLVPTSAPMVPDVPQNPYGVTDDAGRFKLTTYKDADGAAEGGYQIVLMWPKGQLGDEGENATEDRFLGWYDAVRSKLTAQIKGGPNELPPIRVAAITRPPEESKGIPGRN